MKALKYWWPTIAWAAFIFVFSSDAFSYESTSRFIIPFLKWLMPHASPKLLIHLHVLIRKAAHFVEYFLLSVLVLRGLRAESKGWRWRWGLLALLICGGYAMTDEFHQAFMYKRSAEFRDVLLDSAGAAAAQALAWLWSRRNANRKQAMEIGA